MQAFATVVNLGTEPIETTATLSMNGQFLDAETVAVEPGDQTGLSFTIESEEAATLEIKLDSKDHLLVDNVAYAGLTPLQSVSVLLVTDGNTPLELGLKTPKTSKICVSEVVSPSYLLSDELSLIHI